MAGNRAFDVGIAGKQFHLCAGQIGRLDAQVAFAVDIQVAGAGNGGILNVLFGAFVSSVDADGTGTHTAEDMTVKHRRI